jgi:hypothetical protein
MELLDRYLQAVRFWLPKAQQQDIIAELSSDLHSQIDDRELELGRPLDNAELEVILRKCGSPILVASRYRPQTQLIGPALFPIYTFLLKVVLLWILVPVFIVIVGPAMIVPAANRWAAFFETWSTLSYAMFVAATIITLIFAVLERTQAKLQLFENWNLSSLPPAPKSERPPSRTQTVFELICGIGGLLYLLAIPHAPFLILGPAAAFLKPAPMWHSFYLPLILYSLVGLANQCASLALPQWTWLPPTARLLTTIFGLIIVNYMINSAAHVPNGEWHPFVMVASWAQNSAQHAVQLHRIAGIVNASVLITLAVTWFGFCIAGIIQAWQLMRVLRKRTPQARDPALLRMLL